VSGARKSPSENGAVSGDHRNMLER